MMQRRSALILGGALGALGPGLVLSQSAGRESWDAQADVVVVGSGAAGLSAAITAADAGCSVLLAEKAEHLGGDTLQAGGYFNAVDPVRQKAQGIEDSPELFLRHILASGDGKNSPELARELAYGATDALEWLEGLGARFLPKVSLIYGGMYPRSHKPVLARGK
jgi:succinate dehydrogenase/fumarate reductase flavoprotein subunit